MNILHDYTLFDELLEVRVSSADIVDVALRSLWTHPIKNKDSPVAYIDKFLQRYGIRKTD